MYQYHDAREKEVYRYFFKGIIMKNLMPMNAVTQMKWQIPWKIQIIKMNSRINKTLNKETELPIKISLDIHDFFGEFYQYLRQK